MEKAKYLIETYTDEYHSLYQAIQINLDFDKESEGKHSQSVRHGINPNLTKLVSRKYYDKNMKLLKCELGSDEE